MPAYCTPASGTCSWDSGNCRASGWPQSSHLGLEPGWQSSTSLFLWERSQAQGSPGTGKAQVMLQSKTQGTGCPLPPLYGESRAYTQMAELAAPCSKRGWGWDSSVLLSELHALCFSPSKYDIFIKTPSSFSCALQGSDTKTQPDHSAAIAQSPGQPQSAKWQNTKARALGQSSESIPTAWQETDFVSCLEQDHSSLSQMWLQYKPRADVGIVKFAIIWKQI